MYRGTQCRNGLVMFGVHEHLTKCVKLAYHSKEYSILKLRTYLSPKTCVALSFMEPVAFCVCFHRLGILWDPRTWPKGGILQQSHWRAGTSNCTIVRQDSITSIYPRSLVSSIFAHKNYDMPIPFNDYSIIPMLPEQCSKPRVVPFY